MTDRASEPVLRLPHGLDVPAGRETWRVEPLTVARGEWVALVPVGEVPLLDPAASLARLLSTLHLAPGGRMELLGHDPGRVDYGVVRRLRARLGFVHRQGGLLSARALRENVGLPVSVHGSPDDRPEAAVVLEVLAAFELLRIADLRPHQVDGAIRWRACLARAMVRSPDWLVLEGLGDWELERGRGVAWSRLVDRREAGTGATAVCLRQRHAGFEAWFEEHGGRVVGYARSRSPKR